MDLSVFGRGLALSFAIAAPVGPIGVLIIRRTLTEGRLAVERLLCGDGSSLTAADLGRNPALAELIGLSCVCCCGAEWSRGGPAGGNATDRALLRFGHGFCPPGAVCDSRLPFDSARKYAEARAGGRRFVTGAPELLLPLVPLLVLPPPPPPPAPKVPELLAPPSLSPRVWHRSRKTPARHSSSCCPIPASVT